MTLEQQILSKFSEEIAERITQKTITHLQQLDNTLSGDDSGLTNVWDEVCVQQQFQHSFYQEAYVELITSTVPGFVEGCKRHEQLAIWLQTDDGCESSTMENKERLYDHPESSLNDAPQHVDSVVDVFLNDVLAKANDWSNPKIRAYLESQQFSSADENLSYTH